MSKPKINNAASHTLTFQTNKWIEIGKSQGRLEMIDELITTLKEVESGPMPVEVFIEILIAVKGKE
jgi:hypothetical protein